MKPPIRTRAGLDLASSRRGLNPARRWGEALSRVWKFVSNRRVVRASEVIKNTGLPANTVYSCLARLVVKGLLKRIKRGEYMCVIGDARNELLAHNLVLTCDMLAGLKSNVIDYGNWRLERYKSKVVVKYRGDYKPLHELVGEVLTIVNKKPVLRFLEIGTDIRACIPRELREHLAYFKLYVRGTLEVRIEVGLKKLNLNPVEPATNTTRKQLFLRTLELTKERINDILSMGVNISAKG